MSLTRLENPDPNWSSEVEKLEPEFYDATGALDSGKDIELPFLDHATYIPMDNIEVLQEDNLATDGIYHCVGFYAEGEREYFGHATPGNIGKSPEELLEEVEEDTERVTYALGGSPDLDLLEKVRNQFSGNERMIYTGNTGSLAVDEKVNMYRFEREENNPLSTTQ